jgi:hypothetical protein
MITYPNSMAQQFSSFSSWLLLVGVCSIFSIDLLEIVGLSGVIQSNSTSNSYVSWFTTTKISESFYLQYLANQPIKTLNHILHIECADGEEMPYLGYITVDLELPGSTSNSYVSWFTTTKTDDRFIVVMSASRSRWSIIWVIRISWFIVIPVRSLSTFPVSATFEKLLDCWEVPTK